MKKKLTILLAALFLITTFTGCSSKNEEILSTHNGNHGISNTQGEEQANAMILSEKITELTDGLSAVRYTGDYGFDEFLAGGGASSDAEVVSFLMESRMADFGNILFGGNPFGCSTLSVKNTDGEALFGRNFDWNTCNAMVIQSQPENGYHSISTVNTDFISMSGISLLALPDEIQTLAGLYAPLDGLNEMGLAVSVNMIQDSATIEQNTDKPDITSEVTGNGRSAAWNFNRSAFRLAGWCGGDNDCSAYVKQRNQSRTVTRHYACMWRLYRYLYLVGNAHCCH